MAKILEMQHIHKQFNSYGKEPMTVLEDVSFSLNSGEVLGIVGESGSGKSTIAKIITRFVDVTDGSILLEGNDITHAKGEKLRQIYDDIQMVFQTPGGSFDPRRTLGDGVAAVLRNQGLSKTEAWEKASEMMVLCGLPFEFMLRYPHQVSGGECQRAAIARALVVEPKILICDEATSALDVTIQQQIMELLASIQKKQKMSFIFISHNLALVQDFCDRVIVMQDGKVIEEGTPDEIIMHPQEAYTKQLVEAAR